MTHLLPDNSFLGGFFTLMLSGLGFFPGAGLLPRLPESFSGTVDPARREGFLCVISDLSTRRKLFVTASPLLSSENTAPNPVGVGVAALAGAIRLAAGGGGGGGGGGTLAVPAAR